MDTASEDTDVKRTKGNPKAVNKKTKIAPKTKVYIEGEVPSVVEGKVEKLVEVAWIVTEDTPGKEGY